MSEYRFLFGLGIFIAFAFGMAAGMFSDHIDYRLPWSTKGHWVVDK
jgi:hypothetical protein